VKVVKFDMTLDGMGEVRNACNIVVKKPEEEERHHFEDLCMDKSIILKWI
jgi:hypothetical protein